MTRTSTAGRLLTGLLVAIATIVGTGAEARTPWYTVEIVVFERTTGEALGEELWPEQVQEPGHGLTLSAQGNDGVGLLGASGGAQRIQPVPRDQLAYGGVARRLSQSGGFRTLVHMGWRQPGLDRAQALPVSLGAGAGRSLANGSVRGTVRLFISRFLHLDAQLLYTSPDALGGAPFELVESRRIRSGELHYFDHPVFGMLARVTPYQPPGGEYLPAPATDAPVPETAGDTPLPVPAPQPPTGG